MPRELPNALVPKLPTFHTATHIPSQFEDSTHQLWRLEGVENKHQGTCNNFLKICSNTTSPFWQVMQHLFGISLSIEISKFNDLYGFIKASTPLQVPTLIAAKSNAHLAYILTSELSGSVVDDVNLKMVGQLAQHIAELHQKKCPHWGAITSLGSQRSSSQMLSSQTKLGFSASEWPKMLAHTLRQFSESQRIPAEIVSQSLHACQYADIAEFVPLMPDLRWDQFLQHDGELIALVDLDAFVLAPRELDFVLLEYILTKEQYDCFTQSYSTVFNEISDSNTNTSSNFIPDITKVRPAYRLLLFLMQVLGEQDIDAWMSAPHYC